MEDGQERLLAANSGQRSQLPTDALILQILEQLKQQQLVTNQLLHQQYESQEQQRAFIRQQGDALRNIQVPTNPETILDLLAANVKEFRYDVESNITFAAWFTRYEDLFASDAARLDDPAKVRLLIRKLGLAEHERYLSFILPKTPKDFTFDETVTKLTGLFGTSESLISRRYRCLQVTKGPTEDFVTYSCRVNKSCVEFELGKLSEEEFKSLIYVCGLKSEADAEIRTRLLTKMEDRTSVTLEHLSSECKRLMNLRHDTAMIENTANAVNVIKKQKPFRKRQQYCGKRTPKSEVNRNASHSRDKREPASPCWNCGMMHYARDCSFKKHRCSECNRFGHKEGYCSTSQKSRRRQFRRKSNSITVSTQIVSASVNTVQHRRKFLSVQLNGVPVRLQFDTASDISVVSAETWCRLGKPATRPPSVQARAASGDPLSLISEFDCSINVNGIVQTGTVFVVAQNLHIMGLDLIEAFQLDSVPMKAFCQQIDSSTVVDKLKADFPEVFSTTLGKCSKATVKLELKPGQKAVFRPKRPVAYATYRAVDDELDRLERMKIITPVDYSEWAAPIVVVRKANGNIRICGDYSTGLNDALQPHQYPLPLPQDIFVKLANCKLFSIIDMSESYLQVGVDDATSMLLSINTHRGIYKVNRLAPGVKAAPGAFQQLVDTMLAGLKHTCGYIDDIVVGGENEEEHWHNLKALFQRLKEFGFTIRLEKCSFQRQQIKYLGHLLDHHGIRPDPAKIEAIKLMPAPTTVSEVRSFLGAINFYGKFVPNMRALRYPLDMLLKTEAKFNWTAECQAAFVEFKQILSSDLLLTHYNPKLEIIVSADASSVGLGATISHRFPDGSLKVIQHASRALAPAERNYSQPDREGLAIIFAVTKFHRMIFGRKFRLQTDHAPLLRIFGSKKGIPVYTANRLQRWALTLLMYDFVIEYVSTDKFGHADILSRLINHHARPEEDYVIAAVTLENDINSVAFDSFTILPLNFKEVLQSTRTDPILSKVYKFVQEGWPKFLPSSADRELAKFFHQRESLTTVQGCILYGERLVIPLQLRKRCLTQLHQGHPGIQRMKAVSRSYVYWPALDVEIEGFVKACPHCALVAKSPAHASPVPWPKPSRPWQRVHIGGWRPMEEALDTFLLTYRSTPNRSTPDGLSPSEVLFGRRIRTSLELLRVPPKQTPELSEQGAADRRTFQRNDFVYAKVYKNNAWSWVPGTILEKVGNVMFNVWIQDRRLIRSHLNQLRSRLSSSAVRDQEAKQPSANKSLPLDILLDAWGLRGSSSIPFSSSGQESSASPEYDVTFQELSISPPMVSHNTSTSAEQSSSSTTSSSSSFESANASTPTVQLPRRSSRVRRAPQWLNLYERN
ncbi:uncharacterized protein K02A2.6-like [Sabethes cyaneus]|uniref:uncharacterized protein K02A2.6-like n=1 Tax=Sabethes cyaneus TaxID=53552 RepID=UPI00237D3E8A|nr:uncharacterized protein K02A2.6-like [Sabethes cyaneus]